VGWEKVACWSTKAAISLKRVKIDEKLLWRAYIGTHQCSFKRYHPRPPTASSSARLRVRNPPKLQSLLSQERLKLRRWAGTFAGSSEQKRIQNFGGKGAWAYPELPKFFEYPLLSQERVKVRTSNLVRTFMWSIGTKAH